MVNNDFNKQIFEWNVRFPLDRWYRKKHGISFGSKEHQEINYLDILFEYWEEKLFDCLIEERIIELKEKEDYSQGLWIKKRDSMGDAFFDNLDLSEYNDK